MIGFGLLLVLAAAAFAAMALAGAPRRVWPLVAGALMLGSSGYAWQGRPGLGGTLARPQAQVPATPQALIDLRERLMGRFTADAAYFTLADGMLRAGDADAAAQVMLGGVHALPRSYMLWTGLGQMLAVRDGGQVSPAALLAFRQGIRLAPRHPAPYFCLGMAYVQTGDVARARPLWRRALALSPANASYRSDIAKLLMLLERASAAP